MGRVIPALGTLLTLATTSHAVFESRGMNLGVAPATGEYYAGAMLPPTWGNSGYRRGYYYSAPRYGQSYYDAYYAQPAPVALTESDVLFSVRVPRDATVWVNGDKTTQTGDRREFMSSDLTPGKTYTYEIKAQWNDGGKPVSVTRRVKVQAGERRTVDFTGPTEPRPVAPGAEGA